MDNFIAVPEGTDNVPVAISAPGTSKDSNPRFVRKYVWYLQHEARLSPFLKVLHGDPRWAEFVRGRS